MNGTTRKRVQTFAALALITGCTAYEKTREGDAATMVERPRIALGNYRAALAADPHLSQRPVFTEKFNRAKARVKYLDAQQLADQGAWQLAIELLEVAIEADPQFRPPAVFLEQVRRRASDDLARQALEHADEGKLDKAIDLLRQAVEFDRDNERVRSMLDAAVERKQKQQARAAELYQAARRLQQQRKWQAALDQLGPAQRLSPGDVKIRAAAHQSNQQIARSRTVSQRSAELLGQRKLDEAVTSAERAIDIWGNNDQALTVLDDARGRLSRVDTLIDKAGRLADAEQWPAALEAASAAADLYPHQRTIDELIGDIRHRAAEAWTAQGTQLFADGQWSAAHTAFEQARKFLPLQADALYGLSQIAKARGDAAADRALRGHALLWYEDAADHRPDLHEHQHNLARMRELIISDQTIALALAVDGAAHAAPFEAQLLDQVGHRSPPYLYTGSPPDTADYLAQVTQLHVTVDQRVVQTESRRHRYTVYETVTNPRLAHLRDDLSAARHKLRHLQHQYREGCHICRGDGNVACPVGHHGGPRTCMHCGGSGKIQIRVRADRSRKAKRGHDEPVAQRQRHIKERRCRHCDGRGPLRCKTCHDRGTIKCHTCRGSGRRHYQISRAEHRVHQLHRKLECEPATIDRPVDAYWPYTVVHHRITGRLTAHLSVINRATGRVIESMAIDRPYAQDDTAVEHANPQVGVAHDGLSLPDEEHVAQTLIEQGSADAADFIVNNVVRDRARLLRQQAENRRAADDHEQTVEKLTAAALVLKPIDGEAAAVLKREARSIRHVEQVAR